MIERPLENDKELKTIYVGSLSCLPFGQCRSETSSRFGFLNSYFGPAANGI